MPLKIFTSNRSDGSMKLAHNSDFKIASQTRTGFLLKNDIQPETTTLVGVRYEGNDYCRYITIGEEYKGDGIVRQSTIVSDALVVTHPNHALFLPLADCVGAVLYDPTKNMLMVSHLGRHNLEQNGGTHSVEFLAKQHNVNPKDVVVWLSPAAGKTNYPLFAFNNRSLHEIATEQLINAGILSENIDISPIDSSLDKNYYSHSQFLKGQQDDDGRFGIVAILTGQKT
jgi:hypothetical protein